MLVRKLVAKFVLLVLAVFLINYGLDSRDDLLALIGMFASVGFLLSMVLDVMQSKSVG